ncbi:unnamed protein product [Symbiodinium sp. KB8]|nr:unnamed protein product [Symbiodinium sp. KB8]
MVYVVRCYDDNQRSPRTASIYAEWMGDLIGRPVKCLCKKMGHVPEDRKQAWIDAWSIRTMEESVRKLFALVKNKRKEWAQAARAARVAEFHEEAEEEGEEEGEGQDEDEGGEDEDHDDRSDSEPKPDTSKDPANGEDDENDEGEEEAGDDEAEDPVVDVPSEPISIEDIPVAKPSPKPTSNPASNPTVNPTAKPTGSLPPPILRRARSKRTGNPDHEVTGDLVTSQQQNALRALRRPGKRGPRKLKVSPKKKAKAQAKAKAKAEAATEMADKATGDVKAAKAKAKCKAKAAPKGKAKASPSASTEAVDGKLKGRRGHGDEKSSTKPAEPIVKGRPRGGAKHDGKTAADFGIFNRELGCPKCRWIQFGCTICRNPDYQPRARAGA